MIRSALFRNRQQFCDLTQRNHRFQRKLERRHKQFKIHQRASKITNDRLAEYVANSSKEKIAYEMAQKSTYDQELSSFINKFNSQHKDRISLLDFSNYATEFSQLANQPLRKSDVEVLKEFQRRKVDQRVQNLKERVTEQSKAHQYIYDRFPEHMTERDSLPEQELGLDSANFREQENQEEESDGLEQNVRFYEEDTQLTHGDTFSQGVLEIKDNFMIMLLDMRMNTKITTLNRIVSFKTLLFMGNGNGIISHAKGRGKNPIESLERALFLLKKNVIAIPRDFRCTMPLPIKQKFQDYRLELRPIPGFNSYGHPIIALMLTIAGMDHCAFKVIHTEKNIYNVLKVLIKSVTKNTTPQELAEREGFKVYRHQFIRPLTFTRTHSPISY